MLVDNIFRSISGVAVDHLAYFDTPDNYKKLLVDDNQLLGQDRPETSCFQTAN